MTQAAMRPAASLRIGLALVVAVALLAPAGCKERSAPEGQGSAAAKPPPGATITPTEAETGRKACQAYLAQVCACAKTKPELASDCEMARARPQALEMSLRAALAQGNASAKDRAALVANVHNIERACIEDGARLVQRGCPPASSAASPAATPASPKPTPAR